MTRNANAGRLFPLFCLIAATLVICACARTPEQKYARFIARGTAQLKKHDYARAMLEFRSAIQVKPKSADAYYQLAMAYVGANDIRPAANYLRKTLELNPKYTAAELELSKLAVATRNPAELREAEKHVRQVLENSPENLDALDLLATTEWKLGKQEEAEKLLNDSFARFPHDLKLSLDLAQMKLSKNDVAGAEAILKNVAKTNPALGDAAVILGRFYVVTDRPREAEQQFERALKLDAQNGGALVSLGTLRWRTGQIRAAEQLYKRAASLPYEQYKPVHAIFLFQSGRRDLAISEFEALYRQNPADRAARTRLITAYEAVDKTPEAEKVLAAALQKNPKDVDALLEQSTLSLRRGDSTRAQADLAAVLRFRPDSASAHYLLAKVHQMKGETRMQQQELSDALQLNPNLLPARLQLAEWLISNKAPKEARDVLNETPDSQKNDLAVLIDLNWANVAIGDRAAARSSVNRLLAQGRPPQALLQDATLKIMARDYAGGRQSLQEVLQKNPNDSEALSLMVQSYELQKELPAAVRWLREYAAQKPKSAPAQFYLGQVLLKNGDAGAARAAFAAAKAADPTLTAADLNLAQLDLREGKLDEARKALAAVMTRKPNDISARLLLGNVEQAARNYQAAMEQYRKVVELDDRNVEALNNLAYTLAEFGKQPDEALKFAQKAGELAPDNPGVADTLGWVLYRKALFASAIPYLETAASREPTGVHECHLGLAYLRSGDQRRGEQMLAAGLRRDPNLLRSELSQEVAAATQGAVR